jgi:hypothetical protein
MKEKSFEEIRRDVARDYVAYWESVKDMDVRGDRGISLGYRVETFFKSEAKVKEYVEKYKIGTDEEISLSQEMEMLKKEQLSNDPSGLIKIIDSVKSGKVTPSLAKQKVNALKKAGFPFENLDYQIRKITPTDAEIQSLFYVARRYINDNFRKR